MILHAQAVWGMEWYHRPGYWPTTDGVIPYHLFVIYAAEMSSVRERGSVP